MTTAAIRWFGIRLFAAGIVIGGLLGPDATHAQYPTKPIRLVVPIPPGGGPDIVARVIADRLSPLLGQPMVVETRAGSGGNIAMDTVAHSAPDGYTVIICFDAMIVINPHMYSNMSVDPLKDLALISSLVGARTLFLVTNPSLPVKDFKGFIDYARKAMPPLAYASGGNGSQHQMSMELLKARAGINLLHVPYKGGAPAATAVIGGEVPVMVAASVNIPQIRAGKLRILAATGESRSPLFPDIPTIGEFYPGYQTSTWMGLFGPVGIPEPVTIRLRGDIRQVLAMPDVKERINAASSLDVYAVAPEEFAAVIRADHEKYGALVRQLGIKAE
jgi:tripartite-type tricarboxylate transporter receptor subunit TctC